MSFRMKRSHLFVSLHYLLFLLFFIGMSFSQTMWQRNYGGAGVEEGYCVDQTTDGGYIVVGNSDSYGNSIQVYIVKTDSLGDTLWTKTYGGSGDDFGYSVQQTTDDGYIIGGYSNSFGDSNQIYIIKTDSIGNTLWTKTYGGSRDDRGMTVSETTDGGFIITGWTYSFGNNAQVYIIKTDSFGDTLWTKTYGSVGSDRGYSVQQTQDGSYIIVGDVNCPLEYDPIYLIKTDSLGDTLWTRIYGTDWYFGRSVQQTQDGGYIVAGYDNIDGHIYLVKTDSLGDTLWTKDHYLAMGAVEGYSVQQTLDKGYIVAGRGLAPYDYYYFILVKTDSLGDTVWTKTYGTGMTYGARCVQQTTDGGYILVGMNADLGNGWQVWLIKTDQYGNVGIEEKVSSAQIPCTFLIVRPNPFSAFTTIAGYEKNKFLLYDISGRKLGSYLGEKIGIDLPSGVYFIISENKHIQPVRVIKVKQED